MALDLVIFDCDGVLVDSQPVVNQVESEVFAALGLAIHPHEARRRFQGKTVGEAVEAEIGRAIPPKISTRGGSLLASVWSRRSRRSRGCAM